ncbi:MAG: amino acid adenylation domain-containing protein [Brasilonema octagenarum HA4186-MV1]|jgi:amino acid adenylation domain-containing protein|nr:amino acid adenylation domain-containing protein [Brasilonema octagenarum HA4186-MV1]
MFETKDIISEYSQHQKILSKLKDIFVELLGVKISKIDIHTHFLEMGLDSLLLLQIKRAIQEQLDINVPFRLLVEDFSTIHALANHIAQQLLPAEELIKTEPSLTVKVSNTHEFEQENKKPAGGTVLEQVIAQQLELMSKQLELLQKTNSYGKVLPSATAIQATPFQTKEQQTTQSLTNHFVNLASTSIKTEFQQPPTNQTIESQQTQTKAQEPPTNQTVESQQTQTEAMALLSPHQQKHLDDLIARFVQRTQESKRLTQVYRSYHANGRAVSGFVPSFKEMLYPIHGQRGEGARLWDVDGNEYVDISMGFGALLFGHSPSFVIQTIQEQIQQGILHGPQSRLCGHVAELICELTGAERAAFCNDGTEAVMGAIRLARAATGRSKIALFTGSYHGIYDGVLVRGVTSNEGTLRSIPKAVGIPSYIADDVIVLEYGKPESLEILKVHTHELAAVLVEPIQSSRPDLQPKEFLLQLRQLTQATGTVLIFDEVITGFRMHPGGIQGLWDIQADLTTYGKAVAAGMPIGVIAGKAALMDALDGGMWNYGDKSYPQAETTAFAGTFFKHPLVMATAWAALNHIKNSGSKLQEELSEKTRKLADILNNYFEQRQVPIQVVNFGSLFRFIASTPLKFGNLFFYYLLEKGVYVWEGRTLYLSTAHTDEDIEHVIRAVKESVVEMQEGEFLPSSPSSTIDTESRKVPLTEPQKELWFLAQMSNEASRAYNESRAIHLRGSFHFSALRQAVQGIINRHEALRTTFSPQGDYQLIHSSVIIDISFSDFSTLEKSEREAQLSQIFKQEAQQTFNLEQGPLLCFHIVKLEKQHHLLVITNHHIVADGWSITILLRELAAIYSAECQGIAYQLPQPMQLSEYAQWQARLQQSPEMATAEAYWLNKFANSVPVLELPTDRPRPSVNTYTGARQSLTLGTSLFKNLKSLSVQRKTTLFTTLLAGYIALLHRLSGQDDIVVSIAAAGQLSVGSEYLVGHCVNLLPVRTQVSGNQTFTDFSTSVKKVLLEAYEHQIYPFIKLIKNLNLPRDPSRAPLLTTIFNMDKAGSEVESLDHKVESVKNPTSSAKYDIAFNIVETGSDLLVECDYSTDLFDSQTIQRWMEHFGILLEGIVTHPEQRLSDLPLLTQAQQHQLLVDWNNTQVDYPQNQCIHELFEAQVERSPNAIAVVFEDQELTYQQLNQRANQLAHHLRSAKLSHSDSLGVGPEVLVGICVERSLEMVIGLLGILKAGGAYVPLDPSYPKERLAFMLENSQPSVLLTQLYLLENLPTHKAKVVCLDGDWEAIAHQNIENPVCNITPDNLAYVIYTSGSTGRPKGAMNTHQGICNRLLWMQDAYQLTAADRVLQKTPFSFDVSVWEFFWPLLTGAGLVVAKPEGHRDTNYLVNLIAQQQISTLHFVPSMLQVFLEAENLETCKCLKRVMASGEVLPEQLQKRFFHRLSAQLHNLYGPTEAAVDVTYWACVHQSNTEENSATDHKIVPIGHPIANIQIYLLDQHLNLVPVGVTGEVYIGGVGVGRGYLNSPELTAEKFIPNPFSEQPGTRLYKTGDLARYLPNGEIEYIGRIDHQVKIRGFRIELGEIEASISQHPAVRETVVVVYSDSADSQRLVAYVVSHSEQTLAISELRRFLESKLPNYMVPATFIMLEALPLTPNGKVDRKVLPVPDLASPELKAVYQAPQTELEQTIATIWQKALNIENIGIHDNFFELGGHSLLMVKVHSQLRETFKADVSILEMFRYPTISSLAEYLSALKNQTTSSSYKTDIKTENIEAGKAQQRKRLQKLKSIVNKKEVNES